MSPKLKPRVALVTGSSRGLGRDIALKLADVVSAVAVHYHSKRKAAEQVAREVEEKGKESAAFPADLTNPSEARNLIRKVERRFSSLDILVNTVGPILVKPWEDFSPPEWEYIFRTNLLSAFNCMKAALTGMKERRWGRVVNIGYSRVEHLGAFSTITPYAVAKTGLLILTRSVASSVSSTGITVNMVSPGLIEGGVLPLGRRSGREKPGRFEDVSEAVLFLASEKARFITGANLIVAGGWKL